MIRFSSLIMSRALRPDSELVRRSSRTRRMGQGTISVPRNSYSSRSLDRPSSKWIWIFFAADLLSIPLDLLFFYVIYIDDHRKCLVLDKDLALTLAVLRSFLDTPILVSLFFRVDTRASLPEFVYGRDFHNSKWTFARTILCFIIDVVSFLPIPQVLLYLVPKMRGRKFLSAISLFKFIVLAQFLLRFVSMYRLFTKAASASGPVYQLAIPVFSFLVFLLVSHSFGAWWYLLAIERVSECWKQACVHAGCSSHDFFLCNNEFGYDKNLNAFCPAKLRDPTSFDFGMFSDAVQSGIVEVANVLQKFLYCFQWGIRSLCFAHGYQTSTDAWENIFSSAVAITGAVLIPFLLWNVMEFLEHIQRNLERNNRISLQMQEVDSWRLFRMLSNSLKQQIWEYCQSVFQGAEGFDLHQFFSDLPLDLSFPMKRELCLPVLKKVPVLQMMDEQQMNAILDHFKLVPYTRGMFLVREGSPINKMQIIVGRNTCSFRSTSVYTPHNNGEFCGEELVSWAVDQQFDSSIGLPTSTRTVAAVTDQVDAFSIGASALKEFVNQSRQPNGQLLKCFRCGSEKWRNWATVIIQQAWSRRRKKKVQTSVLAVTAPRLAVSSLRPIRPEGT